MNTRSIRLAFLTLAAGLAAPAFAYWTPIQINSAVPFFPLFNMGSGSGK